MNPAGGPSGKQREGPSHDNRDSSRPPKRARVAVACTRCKSRKQKCDGAQPKCGNCKNLLIPCEYIIPSKTIPHGKYQYIKALEARVAELEGVLETSGRSEHQPAWPRAAQTEHQDPNPNTPSPNSHAAEDPNSKLTEATQYLKDLSLHAGGGYVGDESSNITVGHIFGAIAQTDVSPMLEGQTESYPFSHPDQNPSDHGVDSNPLADISSEAAETLLNGYLKHISTRWVVLPRQHIIQLHERNSQQTLTDPFEVSTLNLVYANGGRFLETVGMTGSFRSDQHYQAAAEHLSVLLQPHDMVSIQTLLLHAVYCLRAPRGLSAWTNVGLAIRICISLGLHRRIESINSNLALEVKKRVFWSCYCLDRQVSIILGRPFAISDRDINADLPLDIQDDMTDSEIQTLPHFDPDKQADPSTSLSCFIHMIRLRRIESNIQQSIYRVDRHKPLLRPKIDRFLGLLNEWKAQMPRVYANSDTERYSYEGLGYYEVYYYQCLRLLLYPHLSSPIVDPDIIVRCADACGGLCRSYKKIHRETQVGFSLMAIYAIFLSGLTLLYCLWMSPATIYSTTTVNDLSACSVVLYVIAERWPGARRYRDAFETIKQNVLNLLEEGTNVTQRVPLPGLVTYGLQDLGVHGLHPEGKREYSKMISDMAGSSSQFQPDNIMQPPPALTRPRSMSDQTTMKPAVPEALIMPGMRTAHSFSQPRYPQQSHNFVPQYIPQSAPSRPSSGSFTGAPVTDTLFSVYEYPTLHHPTISQEYLGPSAGEPAESIEDTADQFDLGGFLNSSGYSHQ